MRDSIGWPAKCLNGALLSFCDRYQSRNVVPFARRGVELAAAPVDGVKVRACLDMTTVTGAARGSDSETQTRSDRSSSAQVLMNRSRRCAEQLARSYKGEGRSIARRARRRSLPSPAEYGAEPGRVGLIGVRWSTRRSGEGGRIGRRRFGRSVRRPGHAHRRVRVAEHGFRDARRVRLQASAGSEER